VRQRRKEARPREIVRAALETFTERGFAATKLDDVAARAGVSKGTLYLYFPSKEELFKAVVRQAVVPNIARAERLVATWQGSQAQLLRNALELTVRRIVRSRLSAIPKLVIAEASNFPELARFYLDEVIRRALRMIAGIIGRGIANGEFRPVDVEHTVRLVIAPILFLALWRHSFGRVEPRSLDPVQFCRSHLDLLLNGLRPRGEGDELDR
jgi:AcrR family transcriptional regulator